MKMSEIARVGHNTCYNTDFDLVLVPVGVQDCGLRVLGGTWNGYLPAHALPVFQGLST